MKRLALICFLIAAWGAGPLLADTSDYIWTQQFGKKLVKAEAGDTRAQYEVGNMYLKGRGTNINPQEAYKWFSKSAAKGYKKAEYKLGMLYLQGKGVKRNNRTAYNWMSKAADKGYGPAQFQLGKMYENGLGTSQDNESALAWYSKAEASGYTPATAAIKKISSRISTESAAAARASRPKTTARPAAPRAAAPKVARAPARAPAPQKGVRLDSRSLLNGSLWTAQGIPANFLPSATTQCSPKGKEIVCLSDELTDLEAGFEISYVRESVLKKFSGDKFEISHRRNILEADVAETDSPAAKKAFKKGWEKKAKNMSCTVKSNSLIACLTDKKKVLAFSRQR